MRTGTDVTIEAPVSRYPAIWWDRPRPRLSRATMRNIRQNLFLAFVTTLGVPIAAGILYPVTGTLDQSNLGQRGMTFSSVSVIANALACPTRACSAASHQAERRFSDLRAPDWASRSSETANRVALHFAVRFTVCPAWVFRSPARFDWAARSFP